MDEKTALLTAVKETGFQFQYKTWSYQKVDAWFRDFFVSEGIYLNYGGLRIDGEISALGQAFLDMTRAFLVLEMKFIETGWINR